MENGSATRKGTRGMEGTQVVNRSENRASITRVSKPNAEGKVKVQVAEERHKHEANPMCRWHRWRAALNGSLKTEKEPPKRTISGRVLSSNNLKQYRIKSHDAPDMTFCGRFVKFCKAALGLTFDPRADPLVNGPILIYVSWTFRANFLPVFFSMFFFFLVWVLVFAALFAWAGYFQPDCLFISGELFYKSNKGSFGDVFQLSWTTFSTVGYGSVFPSTTVQVSDNTICIWIQFIATLEAFVGVLYAGFCAAILFGKIARVQSNALVAFSNSVVVKYGPGLTQNGQQKVQRTNATFDESSGDDEEGGANTLTSRNTGHVSNTSETYPCPVLYIRLVNEEAHLEGGGIMDASLSCVMRCFDSTEETTEQEIMQKNLTMELNRSASVVFETNISFKHLETIDDAPDGDDDEDHLMRTSVNFTSVSMEPSAHPFFTRVWTAQHVLDASSPLLRPSVRSMIGDNGGNWPFSLNSAKGVRGSLVPCSLIMSFSGVSNVSGVTVYAHKVYELVDMNVGYQFAPVLYRDRKTKKITVDTAVIHDIVEQPGGGAEELE